MEHLLQISFLDYLAYIPLFLSMHDKMITNPFDMSNTKYQPDRKPIAVYSRDLNPLGHPLSKVSYLEIIFRQGFSLNDWCQIESVSFFP